MHMLQPPLALDIRGLVKRFDRPAVNHLDLSIRRAEFYALLGPNGAGKTTTVRILATLTSAGHDGFPPRPCHTSGRKPRTST